MKLQPLPGQASEGKHLARTSAGVPSSPSDVVFPIVRWSEAEGHTPIGTAFFVGDNGIFLTAKHVVLDAINPQGIPTHALVAIQILEGSYIARRVLRVSVNNEADIALGVLAQMTHNRTGAPLFNARVKLRSRIPPSGSVIFTYAFPRTEKLHGRPEQLHFRPGFFQGIIRNYHPHGRDKVLLPGPCIETSMHIHGCASGGPVFASSGEVVAVNSTGFDGTDVGFLTPIDCALDLLITHIAIPTRSEKQASLRTLARLGFASHAA